MSHTSDFTRSGEDIVLDLVNAHTVLNTPALTTGQVELSLNTEDGSKNTSLTLTSKTGSGYRGSVDVTYNRVEISDVPNFESNVHETESETLSGILQEINIRYGLNLTSKDITINGTELTEIGDVELTPINHNAVVLSIEAKSTSLVWVGRANLTYKPLIVELQRAVGITALDGLYSSNLFANIVFANGKKITVKGVELVIRKKDGT